jgi:hypothetical protein
MPYKIILYNNGKKCKLFHKSTNLNNVTLKFSNMVKNNEVIIPKKLVNSKKLKPVHYELMLLESKDVSKGEIVVRDSLGKIIRNREIEPGWLIIDRVNWKVEETFKVFRKKDRMTCLEIIKQILLPNKTPKQVCCVLNKLIIEDDKDHMEIITCKNYYECGRLHDTLQDVCKNFNIKNIMFFGKSTLENRSELYPRIMKVTGWTRDRIHRTSTRTTKGLSY